MAENKPLLLEIHDQFDTFPRYPHTDHSKITKMDLTSTKDAYEVTTNPGGIGWAYDAFHIELDVPVFSEQDPERVNTGRTSEGLMYFAQTQEPEVAESGIAITKGTLSGVPRREGLVLSGDPGFELFIELHRRVRALAAEFKELAEVFAPGITPDCIGLKHKFGAVSTKGGVKIERKNSVFEFAQTDVISVKVELDATQRTKVERGNGWITGASSPVMTYTGGTAEVAGEGRDTIISLGVDEVLAFTALQAKVSELYLVSSKA